MFEFYEYFLPLILGLGIITSYEDIYHGKIKNRTLITAIVIAVLLNFILFLTNRINFEYLIFHAINISFVTLFCFVLYVIKFWSAGDSKLVITYSIILPLSFYSKFSIMPLLGMGIIIINTIIPFFIYTSLLVFLNSLNEIKNENWRKNLSYSLFSNVFYFFSITWAVEKILHLLYLPINFFTTIFLSGIMLLIIEKFPFVYIKPKVGAEETKNNFFNAYSNKNQKKSKIRSNDKSNNDKSNVINFIEAIGNNKILIAFILISLIRIFIEYQEIFTKKFFVNFIIYYLILSLIRNYFHKNSEKFFEKKINILELRKGMIIGSNIVKKNDRYIISEKNSFDFTQKREFENPLNDEDIKTLNRLYRSNKLDFDEVSVISTFPFAPLLFLGLIITLFLGDKLVILLNMI